MKENEYLIYKNNLMKIFGNHIFFISFKRICQTNE